ncbi:MAG: acyl-CoA carboxylase subunit beta [Alphaproteobacteria bacterium]|nr:MAG: acyl-CoA carboxylase subunit beta [Alphaproteobacteria bacterium]
MTPLETKLNSTSDDFKANAKYMSDYVAKFRAIEQQIRNGEERYRDRATKAGKLLPRERLAHLLDPGSPFLEINSFAGYQMLGDKDGTTAGGNLIMGIGYVSGRRVLIMVWNYAIKGGTINSATTRKNLRLQEIAFNTRLPIVCLSESGGGNLAGSDGPPDPWGAHGFIDGGRVYAQQAELSAKGIPQVTVSHGNATAGGAYQVALSDYIVLVRGQSHIFLAGPPLLKAATGEDADHETLGGAEMHASLSGTGEYLAENDADGIRIAREIVDQLPPDAGRHLSPDRPPEEPLFPQEELLGIVPPDKRVPYDMKEIIARIADGSRFMEFKPDYGPDTVCGHIHIKGWRAGVITNNGPITPRGATKAAQFLQLCDQSNVPMIFLHNTTGFLVGVEAEQFGQVKHGSKMIQSVMNFRPPKITIVVGNSYGAGNYAMCSQSLKPDFSFSWPTARTAVMGGAQAAKVLAIVAEQRAASKGETLSDEVRQMLEDQSRRIEESMEESSEAIYTSARMLDDGLIDPRDTRHIIAFCLETCLETPYRGTSPNTFGVARL